MRFELPVSAFALESSGAAARALGVSHTLTLPTTPDTAELALLLAAAGTDTVEQQPLRTSVAATPPPTLTVTL